jgi:hypothetical protein
MITNNAAYVIILLQTYCKFNVKRSQIVLNFCDEMFDSKTIYTFRKKIKRAALTV